jgi:hypothetical protein
MPGENLHRIVGVVRQLRAARKSLAQEEPQQRAPRQLVFSFSYRLRPAFALFCPKPCAAGHSIAISSAKDRERSHEIVLGDCLAQWMTLDETESDSLKGLPTTRCNQTSKAFVRQRPIIFTNDELLKIRGRRHGGNSVIVRFRDLEEAQLGKQVRLKDRLNKGGLRIIG